MIQRLRSELRVLELKTAYNRSRLDELRSIPEFFDGVDPQFKNLNAGKVANAERTVANRELQIDLLKKQIWGLEREAEKAEANLSPSTTTTSEEMIDDECTVVK